VAVLLKSVSMLTNNSHEDEDEDQNGNIPGATVENGEVGRLTKAKSMWTNDGDDDPEDDDPEGCEVDPIRYGPRSNSEASPRSQCSPKSSCSGFSDTSPKAPPLLTAKTWLVRPSGQPVHLQGHSASGFHKKHSSYAPVIFSSEALCDSPRVAPMSPTSPLRAKDIVFRSEGANVAKGYAGNGSVLGQGIPIAPMSSEQSMGLTPTLQRGMPFAYNSEQPMGLTPTLQRGSALDPTTRDPAFWGQEQVPSRSRMMGSMVTTIDGIDGTSSGSCEKAGVQRSRQSVGQFMNKYGSRTKLV